MNSEEEMRKIYEELEGSLVKPFEQCVSEAIRSFRFRLLKEVRHYKILRSVREILKEFPSEIGGMGDGGDLLTFYNVPTEKREMVKTIAHGIIELENYDNELDILVSTKTPEVTALHYQDRIEFLTPIDK